MGCSTCGSNRVIQNTPSLQKLPSQKISGECEYSIEQINLWLGKISCLKDTGIYLSVPNTTRKQLNTYIGLLLSAQNYKNNICYFEKELEEIDNFIIVITSMNLCL